ncbi:MAG TPA: hypothetical protein VIY48_07805 [Candidatus Paceibacterota bacterium]
MVKKIVTFFDKLEDKIRARLSRVPILYAIIGAVGIILIWKGVWDLADAVPVLWGAGSVALGLIILLMTGLLVSFFIGDSVILSGLKRDKKLADKSEKEILAAEKSQTAEIIAKLDHLEDDIEALKDGQIRLQGPQLPLR